MGQLKYLIRKVERFPFDIVVLQDTKKLGQETMENEDTSFFDSGGRNRMLGTGVYVKRNFKTFGVEFNAASDGLYYLKLRGKYKYIAFINIHSPSEDEQIEIIGDFLNLVKKISEGLTR